MLFSGIVRPEEVFKEFHWLSKFFSGGVSSENGVVSWACSFSGSEGTIVLRGECVLKGCVLKA